MKITPKSLLLLLAGLPCILNAGGVRLDVENDSFFGTDRYYTSGLRLVGDFGKIGDFEGGDGAAFLTGSFTQEIYTPAFSHYFVGSDTPANRVPPPVTDRPYAGYLHGEIAISAVTEHTIKTFGITVGSIGKNSFAEETQNRWHNLTRPVLGGANFQNWDTQVSEKFTAGGVFEIRHQIPVTDWCAIAPHAFVEIGVARDKAAGGLTVLLGSFGPHDSGSNSIRSSSSGLGAKTDDSTPNYLFVDFSGEAVAYDGTISASDSYPWTTKPEIFVGHVRLGYNAVLFNHVVASVFAELVTKEFRTQTQSIVGIGGFSLGGRW